MKKFFIKLLILVLIIHTSFNLIDMMSRITKAINKIYVPEGGTYTFTASSSTYTLGNSSVASVSTGTPYSYTAACIGSNQNYDEGEAGLADCLYTFTASGSKYRIAKNNVHIRLGRKTSGGVYTYYVNSTSSGNITVANTNGDFTFTISSIYMSYSSSDKYISCLSGSANKASFNLYKPIENGETSSSEIPGYIKVNSITSGKQYLIVKKDGNDYYLVYPSTSTENNYSQTAKIKNINGVDYTITGNSVGTTTLTVDGEKYEITVFDENTILAPDSNFVDKALTIGMGTTYKISTNSNEFVWTSNNTSVATVTSDGTVTPVSIGETTLIANLHGVKYEYRVRVIDGTSSGLLVNVLVDTDDETIPYFNENHNNTFYELVDGEKVYCKISSNSNRAINFFGKPKSGYVLSHIYASSGYSAITENTPSEVQNGNSTNLLNIHATNLGTTTVVNGITNALSKDIEGLFGYYRAANSTADITEPMEFRSEKLSAEIAQEIYSVNGTSYQSGTPISAGDTVILKVTVSKTSSDEKLIVYEGNLTNSLSGAVFIGTSPTGTGNATSQSVTFNSKASASQTYYVKYVVPNSSTNNLSNTVSYAYSTYADEALKTASYRIERDTLTDTIALNSSGAQNTTYITITKEVSGNMRETDKYFKFLVSIDGTNSDIYRISGQDSTVTYNSNTVNTSSTYTVGSTNYVYLKGGQTVTIGLAANGTDSQIPVGITYSIVEQDADEYVTTITGIQGETKTTGNLTTQISNSSNVVEFLNSRDAAALTGRWFENKVYICIFIAVLIFIFVIVKYKKNGK